MKALGLAAALWVVWTGAHGASAASTQLSTDQANTLAAVRSYALAYTQNLPNFICTQITHRDTSSLHSSEIGITGSGLPEGGTDPAASSGTVEERLTYFAQQERYDVIAINGRKAAGARHLEIPGAISSGEFGSALREIFDPDSHAMFTWERTASLHGRRVYVFAFDVPSSPGARVFDVSTGRQIFASYNGRVFADEDTKQVLRITTHVNLPSDFPIKRIERVVDYSPVSIAGKSYSLPSHSEVDMQENGVSYVNKIDFKSYEKFTVESTIHFGQQ
jgi:hypothetical protein